MKKVLLAIMGLLTFACTPFNPSGDFSEVRGRVFSLHFNSPAVGAKISIPQRSIQVTTDANGYFEIPDLPTETLQAHVIYAKHLALDRPIHVEPFGSKYVEFWMDTEPAGSLNIVFEREHDIWTTDIYGMRQKNITGHLTRAIHRTHPSWSPDKKQIAFLAYDPTRQLLTTDGLWSMLADGTLVQKMTGAPDVGRLYHLQWAENGDQLLFMLQNKMYVYNRNNARTQNLSGVFISEDTSPVWTLNGSHIIYSAFSLDQQTAQNMRQIFIMDNDGGHRTQLTASGNNYAPAVSLDGKKIAYISERSGFPEIWIMDINGNNPRQITYLQTRRTGQPTWLPDGRYLMFTSDYMQKYPTETPKELWIIREDGEGLRMLSNDAIHADG